MREAGQDYQLRLNSIKNLPPLPEASLRILEAVNDPEIAVDELVDVLSLCPTLVARLLGLANSAYFCQTQQVSDVRIAIIRVLGLNLVKSLVLSLALNVELEHVSCKAFNADSHWSEALTTAVLAQKLSIFLKDELMQPSTVYTSGLLLNIGTLVAVSLFPEEMNEIFSNCEKTDESLVSAMQDEFGVAPYQLGFEILRKWKLPVVYQTVLKEFSSSDYDGAEARLIKLLRLSQKAGRMIQEEESFDATVFDGTRKALQLSEQRFLSVVNELMENKQDIQELAAIISG